jgi:hypothetical protein
MTTQMTTSSPNPLPVSCHSVVLYLSLVLNIFLIIGVIALLIKYFKDRRSHRQFQTEVEQRLNPVVRVNRFTGQVGNFSLTSLENLLAEDENERRNERLPLIPSTSNSRMSGMRRSQSNESTVSDNTFLRNRPMSMKTFKPEAEKSKNSEMSESSV